MNMHNLLISELEQIGIQMLVEKKSRLPMLNSLIIPDGVNDGEIRSRLLNEYQIEIGGGLGPLTGKIWRIGLMGETAREENIIRLIDALKILL
jgi:alanine-glyoxylate transaminase/serine-glyoxylate transaminase/serine-pyruvate transaminase